MREGPKESMLGVVQYWTYVFQVADKLETHKPKRSGPGLACTEPRFRQGLDKPEAWWVEVVSRVEC